MPNWCSNVVKAKKEILDFMKSEDRAFDYENITPMPEDIREGKVHNNNLILKYGVDNWFDWSYNNWGTKWNSVDSYRVDQNSVIFESPWEPPEKLIENLSLKFLGDEITLIAKGEYLEFYFKKVFLDGKVILEEDLRGEDFYEDK